MGDIRATRGKLPPTPTTFHPKDAAHLNLGELIINPHDFPVGRWVQVHRSLLPPDDPYAEVLLKKESEWFIFSSLVHSAETFELMGFHRVFAEECWADWARGGEELRRTNANSASPAFLGHARAKMTNRWLREADRPTPPEEQPLYSPSLVTEAFDLDPARSAPAKGALWAAYEAQMRRVFGLSSEAALFVHDAANDLRVQRAPGRTISFPFDIDDLEFTLLEPRYRLLHAIKRMSEYRAVLWGIERPVTLPVRDDADKAVDEDWAVFDVEDVIARIPRCVDPVRKVAAAGGDGNDPAAVHHHLVQDAAIQLCIQRGGFFGMPSVWRHSDVVAKWVCEPIRAYVDRTRFEKPLAQWEKPPGHVAKLQDPNRHLIDCEWKGIPLGNFCDLAHSP